MEGEKIMPFLEQNDVVLMIDQVVEMGESWYYRMKWLLSREEIKSQVDSKL